MYQLSALELHEAFIKGDLSAVEIARYFLKRAKVIDHGVDAFLNFFDDRVLVRAHALDEKRAQKKPLGRLAAIPIAIKDNIHIKDELTTCSSKILENYRALFDATCVRLLEREDAILIGKTNLDEFAMGSSTENSAFKKTKNPWDLTRTPGGSSGGSAAAVSARQCPIALGSDTGGSIRQPAAFTGIVGFKPTYGRVSRYGLVAFGSSLDVIGPLATNVSDVAMIMEVIGRHCPFDSTSVDITPELYLDEIKIGIQGKKLGVPWDFLNQLDPEIKSHFEQALKTYQQLGVEIVDIKLNDIKYSIPVYYTIAPAEASTNLARFDGIQYGRRSEKAKTLEEIYEFSKQEGFGREVKQRILLGTYVLSTGFQDAYYKKALRVRELIVREFNQAYKVCDIIAMPTTPLEAFKIGSIADPMQMYLQDLYTISANLAGLPGISIPCGFTKNKMPVGFQLLGPQLEDARVLRFAHHFEKQHNYNKQIPNDYNQEFGQ